MNGETKRAPGAKTLPPDVAEAIEKVLEFYWQEQLEAFIADEPEPDEDHCFRSMVVIDQWLYEHNESAEDFAGVLDESDIRASRQRVKSFRR